MNNYRQSLDFSFSIVLNGNNFQSQYKNIFLPQDIRMEWKIIIVNMKKLISIKNTVLIKKINTIARQHKIN